MIGNLCDWSFNQSQSRNLLMRDNFPSFFCSGFTEGKTLPSYTTLLKWGLQRLGQVHKHLFHPRHSTCASPSRKRDIERLRRVPTSEVGKLRVWVGSWKEWNGKGASKSNNQSINLNETILAPQTTLLNMINFVLKLCSFVLY